MTRVNLFELRLVLFVIGPQGSFVHARVIGNFSDRGGSQVTHRLKLFLRFENAGFIYLEVFTLLREYEHLSHVLGKRLASRTSRAGAILLRNAFDNGIELRGCQFDAIVEGDRKSTRLNFSHRTISYAVFCLKKKKK